jgi:formate dehydrogenase beta subunit
MGIGAWKDYTLGIKGEDLKGVSQGINFLSSVADSPDKRVPIGKRAAVVGGGNSAIDCVRTLLRLGCEEVYIVYRRTRKEMPANEVEIEAAEHEGIKFQFLAAPTRVIDDGHGNVKGLEYLQMELGEPDASRKTPTGADRGLRNHSRRGYGHFRHQPAARYPFHGRGAGPGEHLHHPLEHFRQRS